MNNIPVYRIKNEYGKWLVDYTHDSKYRIRVAVWSSVKERGCPCTSIEAAREVATLLSDFHGYECYLNHWSVRRSDTHHYLNATTAGTPLILKWSRQQRDAISFTSYSDAYKWVEFFGDRKRCYVMSLS